MFPFREHALHTHPPNSLQLRIFPTGLVLATEEETSTKMFTRFFFKRMSLAKQGRYLKKKGVVLGTRIKEGRRIYIYMLSDLFVEVQFINDSIDNDAEKVNILHGLDNLNQYLENEFRTSF